MTSKKYLIIQVLSVFGMVLFSLMDIYLYKNGYFEYEKATLMYKEEKKEIDYKVYYKKNDFFETEYLEKDKTYITSLIDHINVDFDYEIGFDHLIKGEYRYYVSAIIESKKTNAEKELFKKEYKLTDEVKKEIERATEYSIHENVNIDYNKYNNLLTSFKKTYSLSGTEGTLKIYLNIDSTIEGNKIKKRISSKLLLQMPLTEMTVEATFSRDNNADAQTLSEIINTESVKKYKTLGIIYIIGTVCSLLLFLFASKKKKDLNRYENLLKKTINTYDSIIVNIKKIPDLTGYREIYVDTFEELLDAHGEVRMPINYYKDIGKSYFILLSDKTAWIYVMSKKKIERK